MPEAYLEPSQTSKNELKEISKSLFNISLYVFPLHDSFWVTL